VRIYKTQKGFWGLGISIGAGHVAVEIGKYVITTSPE